MRKLQPSITAARKFIKPASNAPLAATMMAVALFIGALIAANHRAAAEFFNVSAAPTASPTPKQQGCCSNVPASLRRMVGTYYTTEDDFKSSLVLNNKGPNQIMVTPILHSQNGQTFNGPPVAVGGQSSYELDLNAVADGAGREFRSGSFEFTYTGRLLEMGGGLRIVDSEKSLIFDEQMLEPGMKFSSPQLEAVYALPFDPAGVSVIVTNTTSQLLAIKGQATFADSIVRFPIIGILKPNETSVVDLPPGLVKKASAGAVSINHNGPKGALLAMIHVQDAGRGYSESVNFSDPAQGKTTELHGAGLRLGSINNDSLRPVVAVRNIGSSATTVAATIPYSKQDGKTGKILLPQLSLAPGEIKLFDTSNPQLRQRDFATAGLEIEYKGAPGSVIATANSFSQSGNQVFALPLKDPQGGLSSTGGYPWFITDSSSTVVFIKNTTNEPRIFTLALVYAGGQWGSGLKIIAPGQTFKLDVREVRDSQMKGFEGNIIPLDSVTGHVSWSVRGKQGNKTLIGRAQTVDISNGLASTYECQLCCPRNFYDSRLTPGSVSGFPGDQQQFLPQERTQDCHGNIWPWDGPYATVLFSSDDYNVAGINSGGLATAIGPGSTTIRASWDSVRYFMDINGCVEEAVPTDCSASCDVQNIDFTITHNKVDNGVKPTGIIAGLNGADPAIPVADTQATITVTTNPPTAGRNVTLSVVLDDVSSVLGSGGHTNHTGTRPLGTLNQASGTTNQSGVFTAVYTAPVFGGLHRIRATVNNVTKEVIMSVIIPGLQQLLAGAEYTLTGATATHPAAYNHYGNAFAVANLPLICNDYEAMYPGSTNPEINDMSLPFGGKFEIAGNWGAGSHAEHRVGRNCDFETTGIPANRWAAINLIFLTRNVQSVNDETANGHWHLRFRTQ